MNNNTTDTDLVRAAKAGDLAAFEELDASIIGFIEPLLNPVWVFFFVGEQPQKWAILGGVVIVVTVIAHTFIQYRNRPTTATSA